MLICVAVSVLIVSALSPFASAIASNSTDAPATTNAFNSTDASGGDDVIIGVGNLDVRCYTCDNVYDNDECNGVHLGGNGTLTQCPQERSNCFSIVKMNAAGDGYTTQKGCMDFDECYDRFYEMMADPISAGECLRITVLDHDPLPANAECFFCCFSVAGESQDSCNLAMGVEYLSLPVPNNWDPSVDAWVGHGSVAGTPDAGGVTDGGAAAAGRPLALIVGLSALLLPALLA